MKLDYDLLRSLLLTIEEEADGYRNLSIEYFTQGIPDADFIKVRYHLKYLIDANLIEGAYEQDIIMDITPTGRNYLDHIRDDSIWENTKARLHPLASVPLSIVSQVAASCISKVLGL